MIPMTVTEPTAILSVSPVPNPESAEAEADRFPLTSLLPGAGPRSAAGGQDVPGL